MLTSFKASFLGAFVFSALIFQFNHAHAYLVKVGEANTCVFQCGGKVKCPAGSFGTTENLCMIRAQACGEVASQTCGKAKLQWVHQGPMDVNLDVEKVADNKGSSFSAAEAEKQLDILFNAMPIERK